MCGNVSRIKIVDGRIVRKTDAEYAADLAVERIERQARVRDREIRAGKIGEPQRRTTIEPVTEPANEPVKEPAAPAVAPAPEREPEKVPA